MNERSDRVELLFSFSFFEKKQKIQDASNVSLRGRQSHKLPC